MSGIELKTANIIILIAMLPLSLILIIQSFGGTGNIIALLAVLGILIYVFNQVMK